MKIGLIAGSSGKSLTLELQNQGYHVYLIVGKENESGTDVANKVLVCDLLKSEIIKNFFASNEVQNIIIGTGHWTAIKLAKILEDDGFFTSIDTQSSEFAKNKVIFNNSLRERGYLVPQNNLYTANYDISEISQYTKLPAVVKSPIDLAQPVKVNNVNELLQAVTNLNKLDSEIMIEEFIEGTDYTVPTVSNGSKVKGLGALNYNKSKEYKLQGFSHNENLRFNKIFEDKINKYAEAIIKDFNFIGLNRVDFIVNKKMEIYTLEVNTIIMTSEKSTLRPFYLNSNINIAKEMVDISLEIIKNKKYK